MHLVGFIIRIYHDARSSECQIPYFVTPVRDLSRPAPTTIYKVIKLSVPIYKPILRALILSTLYRALNSVIYLYYGAMIYKQSTTTRKFAIISGTKLLPFFTSWYTQYCLPHIHKFLRFLSSPGSYFPAGLHFSNTLVIILPSIFHMNPTHF